MSLHAGAGGDIGRARGQSATRVGVFTYEKVTPRTFSYAA